MLQWFSYQNVLPDKPDSLCFSQVDALRLRLEEKEATLNKKSKQIQEISEEKGTLNGEIHDLKDMLEVKERKVNVLQKKVGFFLSDLGHVFFACPAADAGFVWVCGAD